MQKVSGCTAAIQFFTGNVNKEEEEQVIILCESVVVGRFVYYCFAGFFYSFVVFHSIVKLIKKNRKMSTASPNIQEESLLKILVATDIHLGVHEKDPVRGRLYYNNCFLFF